jgi:hypothetical protein
MAGNNRDVFGIDSRIGGAWSLDGAVLEIEDGDKLVVTSVSIGYTRSSTKFSPLNQPSKYIALGEADGTLTLGLIIGPHAAIRGFLKRYSDPCKIAENNIIIKPTGMRVSEFGEECNKAFEKISFTCTGCLINSVTISVSQAGGGQALTMINGVLTMSYISLKVGPDEEAKVAQVGNVVGQA